MKLWKFITLVANALWLSMLMPSLVEASPARACGTASGTQMRT
jgi:hypothetical protein